MLVSSVYGSSSQTHSYTDECEQRVYLGLHAIFSNFSSLGLVGFAVFVFNTAVTSGHETLTLLFCSY